MQRIWAEFDVIRDGFNRDLMGMTEAKSFGMLVEAGGEGVHCQIAKVGIAGIEA
jgi:hypothetical protein